MDKVNTVIVDDEKAIGEIIHEIVLDTFEDRINVKLFDCPKECNAYLIENKIDLLITDLVMPEISGESLIKLLKSQAPWAKCVGITGETKLNVMLSLMNSGVDAFVRKPFNANDVVEVIDPCISLLEKWKDNLKSVVKVGG